MKRITYMSTMSRPLTTEEVRLLGDSAARKNKRLGITGVLLSLEDLFFQTIEGADGAIDALFELIRDDERHHDVVCLRAESDVEERLFPEWSMKTMFLDASMHDLMMPLRSLISSLAESHRTVERYTEPAVLRFLRSGLNPASMPARRVDRIVLVGDLVGFSSIGQNVSVEKLAEAVNLFLQIATESVLAAGGNTTDLVGDGFIAAFEDTAADSALDACITALQRLAEVRQGNSDDPVLANLYAGFGIARGSAIEGNIGSMHKMDYTMLGDVVNAATRIEAQTRNVKRAILFNAGVADRTRRAWPLVAMGEVRLKNYRNPVEVFSIDDPLVADFRTAEEVSEALAAVPDC